MKTETCPICKKEADTNYSPFCSKRCSQVDLHRWLGEKYQIDLHEDNEQK